MLSLYYNKKSWEPIVIAVWLAGAEFFKEQIVVPCLLNIMELQLP